MIKLALPLQFAAFPRRLELDQPGDQQLVDPYYPPAVAANAAAA
jgi:hypothetical protein